MNQPLISIVTPSYNQAAFLQQTMDSVLSQGYPALEYFVMDGGSTDDSAELIRQYAPRLSGWVSEKDRGQADGINKGFARMNGEICAWINSDDFYLPGAFDRVVAFFARHPEIDLVYSDVLSVDAEGRTINVMRFSDYRLEDLMRFRIISQPGVFFRRDLLKRSGGLDLSYHFLLDHHLWLRMAAQGKIAYCHEEWAAARFHKDAKNRACAAQFGVEAFRLADWMLNDPLLAQRARPIEKQIRGGAEWLNARYLSEGGEAGRSLRSYLKAFPLLPGRVIEDKRRVALTLLMALDPEKAEKVYTQQAAKRLQKLDKDQ